MASRCFERATVRLPGSDLAEMVSAFAVPLLDAPGLTLQLDDARRALELAVAFRNASVFGPLCWGAHLCRARRLL